MNDAEFMDELHKLKVAECGAIGGLKGVVAGLLLRQDIGLDMDLGSWARLRDALNGAEAAHKAVIDHLCQPLPV